jgi:phosphoglycerate kinase
VLVLENLRFHPEEEANDPLFARQLAQDSGATYFVQDGFGVVHRAHASTSAIAQFLPSVAGLLLESEVTTITEAMEQPKHPLVAILGGAKVTDKIKVIERLVGLADQIIIGGAMANTFLRYKGIAIGKSIHEDGQEEILNGIYTKALEVLRGKKSVDEFIVLPTDVVVAPSVDRGAPAAMVDVSAVPAEDYILDLGATSSQRIASLLRSAATVIWNGTLGMAEQAAYSHASALVAETLANQDVETKSIVGGGDTADFVLHWCKEHNRRFGYISTGGGASLDLMSGEKLPGVEVLLDK